MLLLGQNARLPVFRQIFDPGSVSLCFLPQPVCGIRLWLLFTQTQDCKQLFLWLVIC